MNQIPNSEVGAGNESHADKGKADELNFKEDESVDEILSRRPAMVDNPYNKNLREDSNSAGGVAGHSKRASFVAEIASDAKNFSKGNTGANLNNLDSSFGGANHVNLFAEKTFLSFSSLGDQAEESDDDAQDNDSLDGGISRYEDACHNLMIGTSTIVLKSLKTNCVLLSNYGLNSVRVLALCNALKVSLF